MGDNYQKAEYALDVRRYDLAIDIMRNVLREHPENALAFHTMARAYTFKKDNHAALQAIRESLRLDPGNVTAQTLYASLLRDTRQYAEAEQVMLAALQLDPVYPLAHYTYAALLLHQKKDIARAREHALKAVELDVADYRYHVMLGRVLAEEKQFDQAEVEYQQGLRLDPDNFRMLNSYGAFLLNYRKRPREAFEFFRQALMHEPNDEEVRKNFLIALKAKHPFYSLFWKYSMLRRQRVWGVPRLLFVIFGVFLLFSLIETGASTYPVLEPFLLPFFSIGILLLALFYLYILLAIPIFNILIKRGLIK
jgi:Tfp pilus assembly protein PilF